MRVSWRAVSIASRSINLSGSAIPFVEIVDSILARFSDFANFPNDELARLSDITAVPNVEIPFLGRMGLGYSAVF
jgi:hypothetical protein